MKKTGRRVTGITLEGFKMRNVAWTVGLFSLALGLMLGTAGAAQAQGDDALESGVIASMAQELSPVVYVIYGSVLPDCKAYVFFSPVPSNALPGGRDCCIRDDVVDVIVDGCYWGSIDSRSGPWGSHPFTTVGPFSVSSGNHTVQYCNVISSVGPSGWYVDVSPPLSTFTGNFACGIDIDIKPGSFPNSINTKSKGKVPVAILGSATFDVTTVDVWSLRFGPDEAMPAHDLMDPAVYADHLQDVNLDGYMDLISHYPQMDTGIHAGDTQACLTAVAGAKAVGGCDSVRAF